MKPLPLVAIVGLLAINSPTMARSPFDGTWRPDPQRPDPGRPADIIQLSNGEYQCQSCKPPYHVKADGIEHPISGNPRFDPERTAGGRSPHCETRQKEWHDSCRIQS
jgi:hypothetical protein